MQHGCWEDPLEANQSNLSAPDPTQETSKLLRTALHRTQRADMPSTLLTCAS